MEYQNNEKIQTFTPVLAAFPFDRTTLEILILKLSFKVSLTTSEINLLYFTEETYITSIEFLIEVEVSIEVHNSLQACQTADFVSELNTSYTIY